MKLSYYCSISYYSSPVSIHKDSRNIANWNRGSESLTLILKSVR